MEVAWSKVGAIWRMLEDFHLKFRSVSFVSLAVRVPAWFRHQPKEFYAAGF
jgi:hypothetical protein